MASVRALTTSGWLLRKRGYMGRGAQRQPAAVHDGQTGYRAATGLEQLRTVEVGLTLRRGNDQSPVGKIP